VSHDRAFLDRRCGGSPRSTLARTRSSSGLAVGRTTPRVGTRHAALRMRASPTCRPSPRAGDSSVDETDGGAVAGPGLGEKSGGADRRGTNALRRKCGRQRSCSSGIRSPRSRSSRGSSGSSSGPRDAYPRRVLRLSGAVLERGAFRLGPLDLELQPGERLAITGPNGAGRRR
jgi:ATPase subunit of ABC transporter with duplicated ATPase domains